MTKKEFSEIWKKCIYKQKELIATENLAEKLTLLIDENGKISTEKLALFAIHFGFELNSNLLYSVLIEVLDIEE